MRFQRCRHRFRVTVSAAQRFRMMESISFSSFRRGAMIPIAQLPAVLCRRSSTEWTHNLPADNGIGAVLQHIHFIAHANRRAPPEPPSPITVQTTGTPRRTFHAGCVQWLQTDHALLRPRRISPRGVDKGDDRHLKAFSLCIRRSALR